MLVCNYTQHIGPFTIWEQLESFDPSRHKTGLAGPGVGEWGHRGAHCRSSEGQGCACIFSFPISVQQRDLPAQLEESRSWCPLEPSLGAFVGKPERCCGEVCWAQQLSPSRSDPVPCISQFWEGTPHSQHSSEWGALAEKCPWCRGFLCLGW